MVLTWLSAEQQTLAVFGSSNCVATISSKTPIDQTHVRLHVDT